MKTWSGVPTQSQEQYFFEHLPNTGVARKRWTQNKKKSKKLQKPQICAYFGKYSRVGFFFFETTQKVEQLISRMNEGFRFS